MWVAVFAGWAQGATAGRNARWFWPPHQGGQPGEGDVDVAHPSDLIAVLTNAAVTVRW
jgi:hypothetical protein